MKNFFLIALFFLCYITNAQVIAVQSFEVSGDTWAPVSLSTPPCSSGSDIWDFSMNLNGVLPSHLSQFWGVQDLNGGCGGTSFETISLPNVDVSVCTSANFSFDYNVFEFDNGDDVKYELFYDNISQGEVVVLDGSSNLSTSGWVTETVAIPAWVTNVKVVIFVKQNGGGDWAGIDNIKIEGVGCVACPGLEVEPINEVSGELVDNISCFSADLTWVNGADAANTLVVMSTSIITSSPNDGTAYNANNTYGFGGALSAGEFLVYNGNGMSIEVGGLSEGTTYFVTLFEYNGTTPNCEENYLTGGTTLSFTTLTGCASSTPQIESILYNSCHGTSEGTDEIFTFLNGDIPLEIDSLHIDYPSGSDYCNVGCTSGNTNINNPTYLSSLNTMAGCTVFTYADPIPAGASVMVFTGSPPTTVLDYSSQCGTANLPVYVVFNNNTSTSGRFSNSAVRTLIVDFGNGLADTVTYNGSAQPNTDGATVNFDASGNPSYFISTDCIYPLYIDLLTFGARKSESHVIVEWETQVELNSDYFVVERSFNGVDFNSVGKVRGQGNSSQLKKYSLLDDDLYKGLRYYRLKQVDYNGQFKYSNVIYFSDNYVTVFYADNKISIDVGTHLEMTYLVNVYDLNHRIVYRNWLNSDGILEWYKKGIYIVEIPEINFRQKVVCY